MIISLIVFSTHDGVFGITQLFSGQCSRAININRVLQAVLALVAIGISVSFDFFMRLISSPTVDDLRKAHRKGQSFDIAVHSIRNVRQISPWRTFGWIMLIFLAVPIQWLFHSIAFVCFSRTEYSLFAVSEAFTTGQDFAYPGVAFLGQNAFEQTTELQSQLDEILPSLKSAAMEWETLEVKDCARAYSHEPDGLQRHRNVLLVVEAGPDADAKGWTGAEVWNHTRPPEYTGESISYYKPELLNSLWSFAIYCKVDHHWERLYISMWSTSCKASYDGDATDSDLKTPDIFDAYYGEVSDIGWTHTPSSPFNTSAAFQNISVKYCISEPYQAPCKVYASNFFLLVTLFCIFLGCICSVLVTYSCWHKETCQSIGDALQAFLKDGESFIQVPGALTSDCNLNSGEPSVTRWTPVLKWKGTRSTWGQTASTTIWIWTCVPIVIFVFGGSAIVEASWDIIM
jgi:hypothetical protein